VVAVFAGMNQRAIPCARERTHVAELLSDYEYSAGRLEIAGLSAAVTQAQQLGHWTSAHRRYVVVYFSFFFLFFFPPTLSSPPDPFGKDDDSDRDPRVLFLASRSAFRSDEDLRASERREKVSLRGASPEKP